MLEAQCAELVSGLQVLYERARSNLDDLPVQDMGTKPSIHEILDWLGVLKKDGIVMQATVDEEHGVCQSTLTLSADDARCEQPPSLDDSRSATSTSSPLSQLGIAPNATSSNATTLLELDQHHLKALDAPSQFFHSWAPSPHAFASNPEYYYLPSSELSNYSSTPIYSSFFNEPMNFKLETHPGSAMMEADSTRSSNLYCGHSSLTTDP